MIAGGLLLAGALAFGGYKAVWSYKMSRLRKAIQSGTTNLLIDSSFPYTLAVVSQPQRDRFTDLLVNDLGRLMETSTGWALLNAIAYPDARHAANVVTIVLLPPPVIQAETDPVRNIGDTDPALELALTNGEGRSAECRLVAGQAMDDPTANHHINTFLPTPSDVTLYHELVHAYHFQYGTVERGLVVNTMVPRDLQDVGLRLSEYQATGLEAQLYRDFSQDTFHENRYRAERGDLPQRGWYRPR